MSIKNFGCGRRECKASTAITDDISFGTGRLDEYGFWEVGCPICARAWEREHPGDKAWPYAPSDSCDPENACATHGRCWAHSEWTEDCDEYPVKCKCGRLYFPSKGCCCAFFSLEQA